MNDSTLLNDHNDRIPTLIRENHRLLSKAFQTLLDESSLQVADWFVLRTLSEDNGLMQREVAQRIGMLDAQTGVVIRRLEAFKYVKRISDKNDLRKQCVYLTTTGRNQEKILRSTATQIDELALMGFEENEIEILRSYLLRIRNNLQ